VENLNPRIREYNEILQKLANRRNLPVIDLWEMFASPEGILPPDLTSDGLHLNRVAYERWAAAARPYFRPSKTGTNPSSDE
jgi:lysophospholipase L1-like esterase